MVNLSTQRLNLIIVIALPRFMNKKIKLNLIAVDYAVDVHYQSLCTATIHGADDM